MLKIIILLNYQNDNGWEITTSDIEIQSNTHIKFISDELNKKTVFWCWIYPNWHYYEPNELEPVVPRYIKSLWKTKEFLNIPILPNETIKFITKLYLDGSFLMKDTIILPKNELDIIYDNEKQKQFELTISLQHERNIEENRDYDVINKMSMDEICKLCIDLQENIYVRDIQTNTQPEIIKNCFSKIFTK